MTVDDKVRLLIGDQQITICALQVRVEELLAELAMHPQKSVEAEKPAE